LKEWISAYCFCLSRSKSTFKTKTGEEPGSFGELFDEKNKGFTWAGEGKFRAITQVEQATSKMFTNEKLNQSEHY